MSTYVLNEEKMFSDIADGIAIVINSETGIYYGMNGFGTNIFENLLNGVRTEDLLDAIKKLPEAPEDIQTRLDAFIAIMLDKELIFEGNVLKSGVVNIDNDSAMADSFVMEVKEYDDAQELLLADPIHDVKEETGWHPEKPTGPQ
jgi:hypothetical protein